MGENSFIENVNIVAENIAALGAINENIDLVLASSDNAQIAQTKANEATQSAELAATKANEIKSITVQANTIDPLSTASAEYDSITGTLTLQIPKGISGADGLDGADGISAYQVAVDNGFVGTQVEWIASLHGLSGASGVNGTNGTNGISAYQVAVSNGFVGTEAQWITTLKGEQGVQGIAGADGTMTFSDLTPEQIASLKGEQGVQGITGANGLNGISAYQVAVANGFVGTQVEWIASLKGEKGIQGIAGANGLNGTNGISAYQVAVANGFVGTEAQWITSLKGADGTSGGIISLSKPLTGSPLFTKASVSTITIPIGTSVKVGAALITVSGSAYTLSLNTTGVGSLDTGAKVAGTDYCVYAIEAGGFILSANKTNPTGYTTANSLKIGGFHYGVIPEAFTAINNITASDATKIAGINVYSFWDLKFKPICDPSGMVFANGRWYDIYLLNTNHHTYGTSAAGKTIAGGTILNGRDYPKIPLFYGGDGTTTYGTLTWFEAAEIGQAYKKDLISYNEFVGIAYGVLEATSAGAADTGTTQHLANFTSKFGICMATGCSYIWGKDLIGAAGAAWNTNTEGRGSIYNASLIAALFGGLRDFTVESGSRCSSWSYTVWNTSWAIGCRYACDHLELA